MYTLQMRERDDHVDPQLGNDLDEESQFMGHLILSPERELYLSLQPYSEEDLENNPIQTKPHQLDHEFKSSHDLTDLKNLTSKRSPAPDPAGDQDGNGLTLSITANMDALR